MTPQEEKTLAGILASRNFREVCPDTVRRVFASMLPRYKSLKDADKAARNELHRITGAFMTAEEISAASRLASAYAEGDQTALRKALMLHSSTRERIDDLGELYDRAFTAGVPESVCDLACGLNPLALWQADVKTIRGCDIQGGCARILNGWADVCAIDMAIDCADVVSGYEYPACDMALMMKLLPLLDGQKSGSAEELLRACPAKRMLVTYPTRTLGGRDVGMEKHYTDYMYSILPEGVSVENEFTAGHEKCFVLIKEM